MSTFKRFIALNKTNPELILRDYVHWQGALLEIPDNFSYLEPSKGIAGKMWLDPNTLNDSRFGSIFITTNPYDVYTLIRKNFRKFRASFSHLPKNNPWQSTPIPPDISREITDAELWESMHRLVEIREVEFNFAKGGMQFLDVVPWDRCRPKKIAKL